MAMGGYSGIHQSIVDVVSTDSTEPVPACWKKPAPLPDALYGAAAADMGNGMKAHYL